MLDNPYSSAQFLKSAARVSDLPTDSGVEVAFAGRSNAGKSSALNTLCLKKNLARVSKQPGRTQLINLFTLNNPNHRLVDLPGYGYAKVSQATKAQWQEHLAHYLEVRQCLKGLILIMDCRHPLKDSDLMMLNWSINRQLPVHILLTKSDKLSKNELSKTILKVKQQCQYYPSLTVGTFSSLKKTGITELVALLNTWFA